MWCGQEGWRDRETDECGEQGTVANSARKHNCLRAGRERWGDRETDEYEEQDAVAGCVRKQTFCAISSRRSVPWKKPNASENVLRTERP